MTDIQALEGHSLALIVVSKNEWGEEDWQMYKGVLAIEDDLLFLDAPDGMRIMEIVPDWFQYLQRVDPSVSDVLEEADFVLPLPLRALPEEVNAVHEAS